VGLRTGGRRAKSLKNRVKSSKIELRFREVRSQSSSSRSAVQQAIIRPNIEKEQQTPKIQYFRGFLYILKNLSGTIKTHENIPVTNR
jgi:hypothetical protein